MKIVEKFTDLDKANAYVTEINEAFKKEASEKNAELEKSQALQVALDKSNKETATALEEVGALAAKLDLQEKHGGDGCPIVTINKKSYKLLGNRFFYGGGEKNAEELSKDETELKRMLKIGSGSLVAID